MRIIVGKRVVIYSLDSLSCFLFSHFQTINFMKLLNLGFVLAAFSLLLFSSCDEEIEPENITDWSSATDASFAQDIFTDLYKVVDQEAQSDGQLRNSCATVTLDLDSANTFPAVLTVDFGTGCVSADGRQRSGKVIATFSDRWRSPGATVDVQLDDYTVNGSQVFGSLTITNNGPNSSGNLNYSSTISNAQIINALGDSATWAATLTYTWIEGQSTTFLSDGLGGVLDDVYTIEGSGSGVSTQGVAYTTAITLPLRRELSCAFLTAGEIDITPSGAPTRLINFGNGTCDSEVTLSVGPITTTIDLGL